MDTKSIVKAGYLEATADKIEAGDFCWTESYRCTDGNLAQVVMGLTAQQLKQLMKEETGSIYWCWSNEVKVVCPSTGLPMRLVVQALLKAGFSEEEITWIEGMSNIAVLQAAGISTDRFVNDSHLDKSKPEFVVRYLRTWANMLRRELDPVKEAEKIKVQVSI